MSIFFSTDEQSLKHDLCHEQPLLCGGIQTFQKEFQVCYQLS